MSIVILSSNTILYCQHWEKCVIFYKNHLNMPVHFSSDWLVEFSITNNARVSLADQARTSICPANGQGITLTWQVDDIEASWQALCNNDVKTGEIISHPWGARLFRFHDPDNHRIEIWQVDTTSNK